MNRFSNEKHMIESCASGAIFGGNFSYDSSRVKFKVISFGKEIPVNISISEFNRAMYGYISAK